MYSCPLFFGFPSHLGPTEHGAERALTGSLFSLAFGFTSGCCASGCCDRLWAGISLGTSAGMVQMPLGFQFLSLPIRKAGSCPSSPVARLVLLGPPAASWGGGEGEAWLSGESGKGREHRVASQASKRRTVELSPQTTALSYPTACHRSPPCVGCHLARIALDRE